jgi:ribose transport system permease protein
VKTGVTTAKTVENVKGGSWHIPPLTYRLIGVALIAAALALTTDAFLKPSNLLNVLRQASLMFLIGSGLTIVVLAAGLDLSVGAVVGLSACLTGATIKASGSIVLGIAAGLLCGVVVGLFNGMMVTRLKLPPFIATYGMLWIIYGVNYWYMAGDTIYGFSEGFKALGNGYLLEIPIPVYLMVAFLIAGGLFTRHTTYGHEIYAIGANPEAARLAGIPVSARLILVYMLSGAAAGLAGVVYLARNGSAEAGIGEPLLLPVIAAVLIGGTSLFGGSGGLSGTLIGALILALVLNGMNLLTVSAHWQPMVYGAVVLIAAGLDTAARKWTDA